MPKFSANLECNFHHDSWNNLVQVLSLRQLFQKESVHPVQLFNELKFNLNCSGDLNFKWVLRRVNSGIRPSLFLVFGALTVPPKHNVIKLVSYLLRRENFCRNQCEDFNLSIKKQMVQNMEAEKAKVDAKGDSKTEMTSKDYYFDRFILSSFFQILKHFNKLRAFRYSRGNAEGWGAHADVSRFNGDEQASVQVSTDPCSFIHYMISLKETKSYSTLDAAPESCPCSPPRPGPNTSSGLTWAASLSRRAR